MCGSNCGYEVGPPPDSILSMPPPPLPAFLLPRSAIVALSGNDSHPCFKAFMCEPSPGPHEKAGIEFIEMPRKGMDDTWLLIIISSCVAVLLLGALLAMLLMKCRESYNYTYRETSTKQPPMDSMCESHMSNSKPHPFLAGNVLYPCTSNTHTIQQQMANENRMLWAALTPHGTRHFISEPYPSQEEHYEVIDYVEKKRVQQQINSIKRIPIKSFDNNGFVDYDYEDPTPLIESYQTDDLDSGYQEPQEIMETLSRSSPRPLVSSPTRIENPNMAPLNMYPSIHHRTLNSNGTLSAKRSTLSRRISDASSYGTPNI